MVVYHITLSDVIYGGPQKPQESSGFVGWQHLACWKW